MPSRRDRDFLDDIVQASGRALRYVGNMEYNAFVADQKTQDAVIRTLEIVGEATKYLSEDLRAQYEDVPWRSMAGLRDRLIHGYFGVNLDIVWQIVSEELPALRDRVREIANALASQG